MKCIILIATHKKYNMPKDNIYLPIHVGYMDNNNLGYIGDNTGENISAKNPYYCELTGLFWAWKNLKADYIGLVHYRRHFSKQALIKRFFTKPIHSILTENEVNGLIENYDVILPYKRYYIIETLHSHYIHTHECTHLDKTKSILSEYFPDYLIYFDSVLNQRSGYMFNMFIMKKEQLNNYCEWLFKILFELEAQIDASKYSAFDKRYLGRVSEILFNVWLKKNIESNPYLRITTIPHIHLEKINWYKKITAFLKAKFFKKRYKGSF